MRSKNWKYWHFDGEKTEHVFLLYREYLPNIPFPLSKALHTTTSKHDPVNPPDSIKVTLSWLKVPLWCTLCWPFPDHIAWLYTCWTDVKQHPHTKLYSKSFPPLLSSHSAVTHTTLCSSERLTHTHQTWVTGEERDGTRPWMFFLLLTHDLIFFIWYVTIDGTCMTISKWWPCSRDTQFVRICCFYLSYMYNVSMICWRNKNSYLRKI